ncbi:16S rRNA (adenine(1518)-N(6)/adenine(1519)-N(6))-dimethyltransferase RsmA [bacterium]|jgi:16S rRNA (adenine1518-N6/adenine1519-N6)-dimethyltransferase|nr:16S rRNA (adenine(1518)-N(6)/adenine(1519)-N(6))-dimethyltransferase RsmA [bacterium]
MNESTQGDPAMKSPQVNPPRRQTQTYLMELLTSQGLRAKKDFGQNFLIDLNLLDLLVRSSPITKRDVVLEVGAGTGGLTSRLVEHAGRVVSVEIDHGFFALASSEVENARNVTLLRADALAGKNRIEPAVMEAVASAMKEMGVDHYHLVANLPYDIASSIIANAILHELSIRSLTFTVQLEVGQRILAEPGSRDYGPLSILAQTVGSATLLRTLSPKAFWPRPKVDSAFVRIDVDPLKEPDRTDLARFHRFIRDLFTHRRKNIRGSLMSLPEFKPLKNEIPVWLEELGISRDDRAEVISPAKLRELYQQLTKRDG